MGSRYYNYADVVHGVQTFLREELDVDETMIKELTDTCVKHVDKAWDYHLDLLKKKLEEKLGENNGN